MPIELVMCCTVSRVGSDHNVLSIVTGKKAESTAAENCSCTVVLYQPYFYSAISNS